MPVRNRSGQPGATQVAGSASTRRRYAKAVAMGVAMGENVYRGLPTFIKASSNGVAMAKTQQSSSAVSFGRNWLPGQDSNLQPFG